MMRAAQQSYENQLRYVYRLAFELSFSPRPHFVCADCRRSLQRKSTALPQYRYSSWNARGIARYGPNACHNRLLGGSRKYNSSSQNAAAVEHQPRPPPDDMLVNLGQTTGGPKEQQSEKVSSIRNRLRQWRKGNNSKASGVSSAQIHIPTPNSIGRPEDSDLFEMEETVDHDPDPPDAYGEDLTTSDSLLSPGDMAQIVVDGSSGPSGELCIHIRHIDSQRQFITSKGYSYVSTDHPLQSCKIEGFVSPEELAPIIPYLPDTVVRTTEEGPIVKPTSKIGDIPIDVAMPIVKKLAQVEQDVDAFRRAHARILSGLYEALADDEELVQLKMEDLVPQMFGIPCSELSIGGLLAIDRCLSQRDRALYLARTHGRPESIYVRSRNDVRRTNRVLNWVRMYQESAAQAALGKDVKMDLRRNPLSAFISKAHRLILKSRKIRSPTTIGLLGPSAVDGSGGEAVHPVDTGETLTKDDTLIMQLLFRTSQMVPALVPTEARSICALIYRAIGAYPNLPLSQKVARLLLQELGLIPPWQYRKMNFYSFPLPGAGVWPYQERLVVKAEASCKDLSVFKDLVEHARKDWGKMPVYCIDSSEALEIDDGLSVERSASNPDCIWIHVHVANPAAYISRDHPIAIAARECLSSSYTPSRKFSMMPLKFAQDLSSLAADRPVMTVSSLLQPDGAVAEIQLSLGVIHNVISLTHTAVQHAVGEITKEKATMVIGGEVPAPQNDGRDSASLARAVPDLLLMKRYLKQRFTNRRADWPGSERMSNPTGSLHAHTWTSVKEEPVALYGDKIRHWRGDPTIAVEGNRFAQVFNTFDSMPLVEHAMLLAGESAGKWCKEREIPVYFHVATPHPEFPISRLNQLAPWDFRMQPVGKMSATPQPHWLIEMWQYIRVTSPIRRYPDFVNQLQIQAYLDAVSRQSHDTKDVRSPDPLTTLPFTQEELAKSVPEFNHKIKILKRMCQGAEEHWVMQALFRAFHFKEAELPKIWDFRVLGPIQNRLLDAGHVGVSGFLAPFHVRAELLTSEENWERDIERGQYLPVKIEVVDAECNATLVRAVGPPSDQVITKHPVHIRSSKKAAIASTDVVPQHPRT